MAIEPIQKMIESLDHLINKFEENLATAQEEATKNAIKQILEVLKASRNSLLTQLSSGSQTLYNPHGFLFK